MFQKAAGFLGKQEPGGKSMGGAAVPMAGTMAGVVVRCRGRTILIGYITSGIPVKVTFPAVMSFYIMSMFCNPVMDLPHRHMLTVLGGDVGVIM